VNETRSAELDTLIGDRRFVNVGTGAAQDDSFRG